MSDDRASAFAAGAGHSAVAWWTTSVHEDRRPGLILRNRIKAALRALFEADSGVEVDACALQVSPGNETHVHAFETFLDVGRVAPVRRYLATSPEFACKKLLAAGERKLFTFAPAFRNGENSRLHSPEFTMLEWYAADTNYTHAMDICDRVLAMAAEVSERNRWDYRGVSADASRPARRVSVADAFGECAGIDILATINADGDGDRGALAAMATAAGVTVSVDDTWSDIFAKVLTAKVEPELGHGRATLLYDYPAPEAALAKRSARDPRVAERFELYMCGVELANGYSELTDAVEQRRRFESDMMEKERRYGVRYPIDETFLDAVAAMPEASGCALGFDRLVMLAVGAERLDQVMWTPVDVRGGDGC